MEIDRSSQPDAVSLFGKNDLLLVGIALLFLLGVFAYAWIQGSGLHGAGLLISAAVIGGYMALNIGANDVANNVGPAVGSKAMTMGMAIIIAAIFEFGGSMIAGGDVVGTIKGDIIDPRAIADPQVFMWVMIAGLLAGALWLNLATAVGAPVSTTHAIVGGVLGGGIAAGGWDVANWNVMGAIAASWVISPLLGGLVAAGFLYLIKRTITYQCDRMGAAKRMVPILVAVMAWAFVTYLILKGLNRVWRVDFVTAATLGLGAAVVTYFLVRGAVRSAVDRMTDHKDSINQLFTIPLVFAAALLSFAHGANDVANAVAPLAAVADAVIHQSIAAKAAIPVWVMLVGALGLAIGLALYGPKLIQTVGSEITELDKSRAFCIALSAALTVIVASQLGLPVSSTHIAVGGVLGVGFLREYLKANYAAMINEIKHHHTGDNPEETSAFLRNFEIASMEEKGEMLRDLKEKSAQAHLSKADRKGLRKVYKKELVKRSVMTRIVAAWLITVPFSAVLAGMIYFTIRGMMLP